MKFALIVHGSPFAAQSSLSALNFAQAALAAGHSIHRVFFYHDGVRTADALAVIPQEETSVRDQWVALHENHQVELAVCIAAALKRGILNADEQARYQAPAASVHPAVDVVGLGQLTEATMAADRVVTFGA